MSRRTRQRIVLFLWLALFFLLGFGAWSLQAGHLMLIGYLAASVIFYVLYAFFSRCPRCRMPVLLRPRKLFGIELYTWSLLAPEKCRHCGEPLT